MPLRNLRSCRCAAAVYNISAYGISLPFILLCMISTVFFLPILTLSDNATADLSLLSQRGVAERRIDVKPEPRANNNFDATASSNIEEAIQALLVNMTVAEKVRQLVIQDGAKTFTKNGNFDTLGARLYLRNVGAGVLDSMGRNVDPVLYNEIQTAVINASRHGIGAIFAEECQHGVQGDHHTIFPSPYTLAATFDRDLLATIGKVIGTEARGQGTHECWSPVCGLAREPRWGRSEEEMGEDPYLAGELVMAMTQGMTGSVTTKEAEAMSRPDSHHHHHDYNVHHSLTPRDSVIINRPNLTRPDTVAPLVKHYAAYSVPESGRNAAPAHMGTRELQSTYLPVFAKAIAGGAQGAMSSYNEIDGVPTSGDKWLLTDELRGRLGFDGYVASDFGAISGLGPGNHATAANDSECVRQFLSAGGSVNGHDFGDNYELLVAQLVAANRLSASEFDTAVANVLRVKARLGLIPGVTGVPYRPLVDTKRVQTYLGDNAAHVKTARRAALESVVLLSNDKNTLPIPPPPPPPAAPVTVASLAAAVAGSTSDMIQKNSPLRILVVGPNADEVRTGDYSAAGWAGGAPNGGGNINNNNSVTILEGLKRVYGSASITQAVGTGLVSTVAPYYTVVQRHSFSVASEFSPTAPSSPYAPTAAKPLKIAADAPGLRARYYSNTNCSGTPVITRLDYAVNWHFFALGPDPSRLRSATFSVRWDGKITPDATVSGAQFNIELCHGHSCGTPSDMGARLRVNGQLVIDAWQVERGDDAVVGKKTVSGPINIVRGVPLAIEFDYWQAGSTGDPAVALQWSLLPAGSNSTTTISDTAATAAADFDVVVVVVGGANNDRRSTTEGEGKDRASLSFPGAQLDLINAMANATATSGGKLVTVLVDGRPTAEPVLKTLPAVLAAFQGGQAQGEAVAAIISGAEAPSGKLPVSFPVSAEVLPVYYNRKPSASRGGWIDHGTSVLWPFGHGLSYTTFAYSDLKMPSDATTLPSDTRTVTISAQVKNTGNMAGVEVAQLYVRDVISSVTTPVLALKGFERVSLAPGQSKHVIFTIQVAKELAVLNRAMQWVVEPGDFEIYVGGSSDNLPLKGKLTLV